MVKHRDEERGVVGSGVKVGNKIEWDAPIVLKQALADMPDGRVIVRFDLASEKAVRSVKANRYYRYALSLIAKDTGNDTDTLHEYYLSKFSTQSVFVVNKQTGEAIERTITKRTSKMPPEEFWEYTEKVRQDAAEFFGVIVPDPDPLWRERDRSAA